MPQMTAAEAKLKVRDLLAVVADASARTKPSEADLNVARNAAFAACVLVCRHKLAVIQPEEIVQLHVPAAAAPTSSPDGRRRTAARKRRGPAIPSNIADILGTAAGDVVDSIVQDALRRL